MKSFIKILVTPRSAAAGFPKCLLKNSNRKRVELSQQCRCRFEKEGDDFLKRVITCDETWVWHYEPEPKRQSWEWKHSDSPVRKFTSDEEIKNTVSDWLKSQSKEFYKEDKQKLVY